MQADVRPARIEDLPELIGLAERTIRVCYGPFLGGAAEEFVSSGAAADFVRGAAAATRVLVGGGAILGLVTRRGDEVELLMVDPAHQRRGLGGVLLRDAEDAGFAAFERLRLESFEANGPANAFYRAHGWRVEGRAMDPISGKPKLRMFKRRGVTSPPGAGP